MLRMTESRQVFPTNLVCNCDATGVSQIVTLIVLPDESKPGRDGYRSCSKFVLLDGKR